MPPKKRTLKETNPNIEQQHSSKHRKSSEQNTGSENQDDPARVAEADAEKQQADPTEQNNEEERKFDEYVCMPQPYWDMQEEREHALADENCDETDEDELHEAYKKQFDTLNGKPAADLPEHKWVMMRQSVRMLNDWRNKGDYCCPDSFGMYVYNDFHANGMFDLVEKALRDFNAKWTKKNRNLHQMWAVIAMLGHWIHDSEFGIVSMIDDGDRCYEFFPLLGFAFITALEAVDTAGQLHEGSDIRDLGLVMSLFADWRLEDGLADGEDLEISWRETVVAYAKKASIDLEAIRPHAMKPVLEDSKDVQPVRAAPKSKAADRWGFKKMLTSYKKDQGLARDAPFKGGPTFDITKWTRAERAQYAFDKKDPLADIPIKELKNDGIMLG